MGGMGYATSGTVANLTHLNITSSLDDAGAGAGAAPPKNRPITNTVQQT